MGGEAEDLSSWQAGASELHAWPSWPGQVTGGQGVMVGGPPPGAGVPGWRSLPAEFGQAVKALPWAVRAASPLVQVDASEVST